MPSRVQLTDKVVSVHNMFQFMEHLGTMVLMFALLWGQPEEGEKTNMHRGARVRGGISSGTAVPIYHVQWIRDVVVMVNLLQMQWISIPISPVRKLSSGLLPALLPVQILWGLRREVLFTD